MKLIKRHKGLALICLLTLILFGIIFVIISPMITSGSKSEYGDRLNGVPTVSEKTLEEAESKLKEYTEVEDVKIRIQGKIIYTTITFTNTTSKDKAKEIASKTLEYYDDKIKESYDFDYLLTQKKDPEAEEDKTFTIAGGKHPDINHISWTRN